MTSLRFFSYIIQRKRDLYAGYALNIKPGRSGIELKRAMPRDFPLSRSFRTSV